jgi:hypothetical protein
VGIYQLEEGYQNNNEMQYLPIEACQKVKKPKENK